MRVRIHPLFTAFVLIAIAVFGGRIAYAQTSGAVRVVNAFYTWYLATHGDWTNISGARAYLTPSLYASLEKLVSKERQEQAQMLDFDPFSGAQAEPASYAIGSSSNRGTSAVQVRVRLSGGNGSTMVRVIVVHTSSGLKIDNFVYPGMGDLRRALRDALK